MTPRWSRTRIATLAGLGCSFVFFAYPVTRSRTERDPLAHHYTDHLRYRYCSSLVLRSPIDAVTRPLGELYARDTHGHRVLLWEEQPCHHAGVVHVAIHAPFHWLLASGALQDHQATNLYVLLLLLLSHACLWLLLTSPHWWAGVILYPILIRYALTAVQEPISFLLALLAAMSWGAGRRARALAFLVLAFSSYPRWAVWAPPFLYLGWRERGPLAAELRAVVATRRGRALAIGLTLVFAWSALAALLVALNWVAPPGGTSPFGRAVLVVSAVVWGAYWLWDRASLLAPFALTFSIFLARYHGGLLFWYLAPLLALAPFARRRFEIVAWAVSAAFLSELAVGEHGLATLDLWRFSFGGWMASGS